MPESWFSNLTRRLGNFAAVCYTIVSLLRQSFSESLDSGLSSEKLVICEISHFKNFNRSLVYFPWIKSLTTLQLLITLNGINMTPAFLKKGSIDSLLKKLSFAQFCILLLFLNTFFINYKHLEQLYRYLKFKC